MCNKFIDISEHNSILSFKAIPDSNLKGVIMKATEGTTYIDHALEINYQLLQGKINLGFYHYLKKTSSPITQARNFWNNIKDKEFEILPILDIEDSGLGAEAENYANQFLQEVYQLSGHSMIIYSGRAYIEEHFTEQFKRDNVWWVADYSAKEIPQISGCDIIAWQYTEDCQNYAFAMNNLDCSILYNEEKFFFRGSVNRLKQLVVYGEGADKRGAEYLADFYKCPTCSLNNLTDDIKNNVEQIYMVGGQVKPTENTILISGGDRFATMQAVLKQIGV